MQQVPQIAFNDSTTAEANADGGAAAKRRGINSLRIDLNQQGKTGLTGPT
jgi:hypothetical protein